jgi:hypothetical protein
MTASKPVGGAGGPITNVPAGGGAGGPITCGGGSGRFGLAVGGGTGGGASVVVVVGLVTPGVGFPPAGLPGFFVVVADGDGGGLGFSVVVVVGGGGVGLPPSPPGQAVQWYTRLHFFSHTSVGSSSHTLVGWLRQVDLYLTHWQSCTFAQQSGLLGGLANSNFWPGIERCFSVNVEKQSKKFSLITHHTVAKIRSMYSQFLYSCICDRFIYSQDQSAYLDAAK